MGFGRIESSKLKGVEDKWARQQGPKSEKALIDALELFVHQVATRKLGPINGNYATMPLFSRHDREDLGKELRSLANSAR